MNQKTILESISKAREISKKRKFPQSFDLIINLTQLDPKDQAQKVDAFIHLPHQKGKIPKICALVGTELESKAKVFDKVITKEDFQLYQKDIKKVKKLVREYDYFIAQANLMSEIASTFGKGLGTVGKMPNPKAGCIIPPVIPDLKPVKENLSKTIRFITKEQLIVKSMIGNEKMKDEEIADNISAAYNSLIHVLPKEENNIRSVYIKLTMGPAIEITDKGPVLHKKLKEDKKKQNEKNLRKKEKGS